MAVWRDRNAPFDDFVALEKSLYRSVAEAKDALNSVVRDKYARLADESAHEWLFQIAPSVQWLARYDPHLAQNSRRRFFLPLEEINSFARLTHRANGPLTLFACDHTWALWAWSHWLRDRGLSGPRRPLIIHFDDHEDLRTAPVCSAGHVGVFSSPLDARLFRLDSPGGVAQAIRRGFIGIGGFIAPLLHTIGPCDIAHFRADSPHRLYYEMRGIQLAGETISFARKDWATTSVRLVDIAALPSDASTYIRTNDLALLSALPVAGRPILLDIDMDYFCNRQEGEGEGYNGGAGLHDVLASIDLTLSALLESQIASAIEVITVALSPGFFPSEYWTEAIPRVESALKSIRPRF